MKPRRLVPVFVLGLVASPLPGAGEPARPVTPWASAEATALLQVLYDLSGKHTLLGQHNFPNTRSRNSDFVTRYLGKTAAVYSQDFGFAEDGDKDSFLARPDIVEEIKEQHRRGALIVVVRRTHLSEYDDHAVTEETMRLDGMKTRSELRGASRVSSASWSGDGDALTIRSTVTFRGEGASSPMTSSESWSLSRDGRELLSRQSSTSPWGDRSAAAVHERR